jgi:hypothetical protein
MAVLKEDWLAPRLRWAVSELTLVLIVADIVNLLFGTDKLGVSADFDTCQTHRVHQEIIVVILRRGGFAKHR